MFCKNCGNQIPDDSITCAFCGSSVNDEQNAETTGMEFQQNFEQPQEAQVENTEAYIPQEQQNTEFQYPEVEIAPQPKKKSFKAIIIAAVLAVVALLVCVFSFSSKAQNTFMKMTPSDTHYRYVIKNTAKSFTNSAAKFYDDAIAYIGSAEEKAEIPNTALQGNVYLEVDGQIKEMIETAGVEENKVSVDYKINMHDSIMAFDLGLNAGSQSIITAQLRYDIENMKVSALIPELSEEAIYFDIKDNEYFDYEEYSAEYEEQTEMIKTLIKSIGENAPKSDSFEKLLTKYIKIVLEQITEVERTSEKLDIKGVAQKTTRFDIEITEELLFNIVKAVLTEAKEDEDIKDIINEYYDAIMKIAADVEYDLEDSMTASELYTEFKDAIDDMLDSLSDSEDDVDDDALLSLTMWVNSDGQVIAVKIEIEDADSEMFFGVTNKGKEYGYEFYIESNNSKVMEISGHSTKDGNKLSGEVEIEMNGEEVIVIEVSELDCKALESNGAVNGTFKIKAGEFLTMLVGRSEEFDISKAEIVIVCTGDEQKAAFDISLKYDGDKLATIGSSAEIKDSEAISLHKDYTENVEEWAAALDVTTVMENLQKVLGENFSLEDLMGGATDSDDYYDDYEDDYYYSDEDFDINYDYEF